MKTGILFDLDGTLLDTLGDLHDSVNHTLHTLGWPERSREEVRRFVGNGAAQLLRLSVPEGVDWEQAYSLFRPYYDAHCRVKTRPYEGVSEALAELGAKYPLAIVSNKPDSAVKLLCADYFPGIYALGERSGCPRKPAADMVLRAMAEIGVQDCIYVGDSEVDILTAQNAGVRCLSVLWGFRDRDVLESSGGKDFCAEPGALADKLQDMLARSQA